MRALLVATLVAFSLSAPYAAKALAADEAIVEKRERPKASHPKGKVCPKTGKPL